MLGKCVDDPLNVSHPRLKTGFKTHPDRNDRAVQHLLAAPSPLEPITAHIEHDDQYSGVTDESAAHDVVSGTLAQVAISAKSQSCSHTE